MTIPLAEMGIPFFSFVPPVPELTLISSPYNLIIPILKKPLPGNLLRPIMEPALQGEILLTDIRGKMPVLPADEILHHLWMASRKLFQGVDRVIIIAFYFVHRYRLCQFIEIVKFLEIQMFL